VRVVRVRRAGRDDLRLVTTLSPAQASVEDLARRHRDRWRRSLSGLRDGLLSGAEPGQLLAGATGLKVPQRPGR